ncbi:hypothetical protein MWU78_21985 [Arenibacter sp. F26102]|nr:hypothetical protein [Arenibacter sp. F26102]MCK0148329.1 hypothetical protein [Arenibacter sp. F26102]
MSSKSTADRSMVPGLIQVQINGYMGVDFYVPDLTVQEVRKATKALFH